METKFITNIISTQASAESNSFDANFPLSFLHWKSLTKGINDEELQALYTRYVTNWVQQHKEKTNSKDFSLRQKYLYLLKQLQLYFTTEEKNSWYAKINFGNDRDILTSIPFFAKRLKDISLYYLNLRKKIQKAKIKYNVLGTALGIEQEVYNYLLETFSSSNINNDPAIQAILPNFSNLQNTLNVKVEELYDDNTYFDRSLTNNLSSYVDIFHEPTSELFLSKGIVLSSSEWVFDSLSLNPTTDTQGFVTQLTGILFETPDENLYGSYIQKYLGETKFATTFAKVTSTTNTKEIPLTIGNNTFYYPFGGTHPDETLTAQTTLVSLSSLQIGGATAGLTIESSDTMFVKVGNDVKGAWLRYKDYETSQKTIEAYFHQNTTSTFIYPYVGYGLSGNNFEWTGPSITTDEEYVYLAPSVKKEINNLYWSNSFEETKNDTVNSIMLANASLIADGAYASTNPNHADNVFVTDSYSGDTQVPRQNYTGGAWLFKHQETSLPVIAGSPNIYFWPYSAVDAVAAVQGIYEKLEVNDSCDPLPIQNLNTSFFNAADSFELADKIYILKNPLDDIPLATQCCWLSTASLSVEDFTHFKQDGFNALFNPGETTHFVWTGEDNISLETVFKNIHHSSSCPLNIDSVSTSISGIDWQKCNCKQVYYSPFGHPGKQFLDYNNQCDFICEDISNKLEPFDIESWRDEYDNNTSQSAKFAWYKTNNRLGWGDGIWSRGNGRESPLTLKKGKAYYYYRANSKTGITNFPVYNVLYKHNTKKTKWVTAKKNLDQEWVSSDQDSSLILYPGDFVVVDHNANTTSFYLTATELETYSSNSGSLWSSLDYISLGSANSTYISWPLSPSVTIENNKQLPPTSFENLSAILWWKVESTTNPSLSVQKFNTYTDTPITTLLPAGSGLVATESVTRTYQTDLGFTFTATVPGIYKISVCAVTKDYKQYTLDSTTIPLLSVVPQYTSYFLQIPFETPSGHFLIEEKLTGWEYPDKTIGAKPYWAELYTNKDTNTDFKGTVSWGYPNEYINGCLPNSTPKYSLLNFETKNVIDYVRNGPSFWWYQPITYKKFINTTEWSKIDYVITEGGALSSVFSNNTLPKLTTFPRTSATDIVLSNKIDGKNVEIVYNSMADFTWTVTYETPLSAVSDFDSSVFFNNPNTISVLSNRFNSTIATLPTLEYVYSTKDVGGYFLPKHLGASQYINKNFTAISNKNIEEGTALTENILIHIGGRGLTKTNQETQYTWTENNEWLKNSLNTNELAGYVKKELEEQLQTFVPYQATHSQLLNNSTQDNNPLTPWKVNTENVWADKNNEPKSFTGVLNISSWAKTIDYTKRNDVFVDSWTTDLYGNQYCLVKKEANNSSINDNLNLPGQLWIQKENNEQMKGVACLSGLFKTFSSEISSTLSEFGILRSECFYNTLMLQTSSILLFASIDYDYSNSAIFSITDNSRFNLLSDNFQYEQTWFNNYDKQLKVFFTETESFTFIPVIYNLDITNNRYTKVFPYNNAQNLTIVDALTGNANLPIKLNKATIAHNSLLKEYSIIYSGIDSLDNLIILKFDLTGYANIDIKSIRIYKTT